MGDEWEVCGREECYVSSTLTLLYDGDPLTLLNPFRFAQAMDDSLFYVADHVVLADDGRTRGFSSMSDNPFKGIFRALYDKQCSLC